MSQNRDYLSFGYPELAEESQDWLSEMCRRMKWHADDTDRTGDHGLYIMEEVCEGLFNQRYLRAISYVI